jgi:hypothetical protein
MLRIAIRIRGGVATLQPDLVRPVAGRPVNKEISVELDAAFGLGVDLDHPAVEPLRIELRVDRAVQRVRKIDPAFAGIIVAKFPLLTVLLGLVPLSIAVAAFEGLRTQ